MAEDMTPLLAALSFLPEKRLQALQNKLSDIGVECEGDLQFVREVDLHDILTPLECRKLLRTWRVEGTSWDSPGGVWLSEVHWVRS